MNVRPSDAPTKDDPAPLVQQVEHAAAPSSPLGELGKRIASGLGLVVIALAASWTGGLIALATFCLLGLFVLAEWERLTRSASRNRLIIGMLVVAAAGALAHYGGPVIALAFATALLFLALGSALLESHRRWSFTGIAYAAWLVVSLVSLRGHDAGGLSALLFVFIAVWATDIAAYFGGRAMGGPKLMPSISPKKTWSGAISGLVATLIAAALYLVWVLPKVDGSATWLAHMADPSQQTGLAFTLVLAGLLSIAAQAGDLFESGLKRRFGAKDSGTILPGHGGFMDRVDGLVFASTAAFLFGLSFKGQGTVAQGVFALGSSWTQLLQGLTP